MGSVFLETREDLEWLRDVHCPDLNLDQAVCAILTGNEDSPISIEVFSSDDYRAVPFYIKTRES